MLMGGIHGKNLSSQLIVGPKVGKRSGGSAYIILPHIYLGRLFWEFYWFSRDLEGLSIYKTCCHKQRSCTIHSLMIYIYIYYYITYYIFWKIYYIFIILYCIILFYIILHYIISYYIIYYILYSILFYSIIYIILYILYYILYIIYYILYILKIILYIYYIILYYIILYYIIYMCVCSRRRQAQLSNVPTHITNSHSVYFLFCC